MELEIFNKIRKEYEKKLEINFYNTSFVPISTAPESYHGYPAGTDFVLVQERDDITNKKGRVIQYFGGWNKKEESPIQTVQREIKEEISRFLIGEASQIYFPNPEDHLFFNQTYGNWFSLDLIAARISWEDALEISEMTPKSEGLQKLKEGSKIEFIPNMLNSLSQNWVIYDAIQSKMLSFGKNKYEKISFQKLDFPMNTKRLETKFL